YRRFGRLSARLLLHLQNDLNNLEKKLDALDKQYAQDERMKYRLRGFEISDGRDDKCQKFIRALGKAPRRNHMANFTWMQNEKALNEEKRDFLNHPDDFISISRNSGHRIEDFIQSWLDNRGPNFFIKVCPDSYYLHSRMRWGSNADDSIAFLEDCGGTQKD
ncbi:hypothetical protein DL95DRAFT_281801, partial [Leptodontidium sp. 2 PMI_412]